MSDLYAPLVRRLREMRVPGVLCKADVVDAADELERLSGQLEALREALKQIAQIGSTAISDKGISMRDIARAALIPNGGNDD